MTKSPEGNGGEAAREVRRLLAVVQQATGGARVSSHTVLGIDRSTTPADIHQRAEVLRSYVRSFKPENRPAFETTAGNLVNLINAAEGKLTRNGNNGHLKEQPNGTGSDKLKKIVNEIQAAAAGRVPEAVRGERTKEKETTAVPGFTDRALTWVRNNRVATAISGTAAATTALFGGYLALSGKPTPKEVTVADLNPPPAVKTLPAHAPESLQPLAVAPVTPKTPPSTTPTKTVSPSTPASETPPSPALKKGDEEEPLIETPKVTATEAVNPPSKKEGADTSKSSPSATTPSPAPDTETPDAAKAKEGKAQENPPSPSSEQRDAKRAIPSQEELKKFDALSQVPAFRAMSAKALRGEAMKATDPAEQWTLFMEAYRRSKKEGNTEMSVTILDELSQRYDGKDAIIQEKVNLLTEATKGKNRDPNVLTPLVLKSIRELCELEKFDDARQFASRMQGRSSLHKPKINDSARFVTKLEKIWQEMNIATHRETLANHPEDPKANEAVGLFLCLEEGDWHRGLPHLAKADDTGLRSLAERTQQRNTSTTADLKKLIDDWKNVSPSMKPGTYLMIEECYERSLLGLEPTARTSRAILQSEKQAFETRHSKVLRGTPFGQSAERAAVKEVNLLKNIASLNPVGWKQASPGGRVERQLMTQNGESNMRLYFYVAGQLIFPDLQGIKEGTYTIGFIGGKEGLTVNIPVGKACTTLFVNTKGGTTTALTVNGKGPNDSENPTRKSVSFLEPTEYSLRIQTTTGININTQEESVTITVSVAKKGEAYEEVIRHSCKPSDLTNSPRDFSGKSSFGLGAPSEYAVTELNVAFGTK